MDDFKNLILVRTPQKIGALRIPLCRTSMGAPSAFIRVLKPHQVNALNYHHANPISYNCFDMGLGKSLTSIALFHESQFETLTIICPAYLKQNWISELIKWGIWDQYKGKIHIRSYAARGKMTPTDMYILDEFHYIKNFDAQRTQRIFRHFNAFKPKKVIGLSGTPMKKDASDFYSYLMFVRLFDRAVKFPINFYQFQATFCQRVPNDFTPSGYSYEGVNDDNLPGLKKLIAPFFHIKKTKDVLDLPDTVNMRYVSKKKNDRDILYSMAVEQGRSKEFMAIKALNAEENTKTSIKLIQDLIYQGKRPVVFTEHRKSALIIAEKFGTVPVMGGTSTKQRENLLQEFDDGKSNTLIGTFGAMGSGLNIVSSDTMVFNDYSFSPSDYEQARKRIHRIGQEKQCFYHHVFASDMDYIIFKKLMKKQENVDRVES